MSTFPISFEFFPPKTPLGMDNLRQVAIQLARVQPEFFSITYGAGGTNRDGTLNTVRMLRDTTPVQVVPHLTSINLTRDELKKIILHYQSNRIKRLVILRGDIPSGIDSPGDIKHACDLVALIRDMTGDYFHIEVAAYPECHPQAANAEIDFNHFKNKVLAGANSAITQYFFNVDAYFAFVDQCAKNNVFIPIVPGIMPITNFDRLVRFSTMCGAEIPRWIYKRLEVYQHDLPSLQSFGKDVVAKLCQQLQTGGAPGLHFYTLNSEVHCLDILKQMNFDSLTSPMHQPNTSTPELNIIS